MIPEELHKKVDMLLIGISDEGKKQFESLKELVNKPIKRNGTHIKLGSSFLPNNIAMAKILADPDMFLAELIESFWKLYGITIKNLSNPIVQYSMRSLLELCYSTIYFYNLKTPAKQERAIKYWLCNTGFQLTGDENQKNKTTLIMYDALLEELQNKEEKTWFDRIRKKSFPFDDLTKTMTRLFPTLTNNSIITVIGPWLTQLWGTKFSDQYLPNIYRWLSQYSHPNTLFIRNLIKEEKDMSHIFRCSLIFFLTGFHLLSFINNNILKNDDNKFNNIKDKISELVMDLTKYRNLL